MLEVTGEVEEDHASGNQEPVVGKAMAVADANHAIHPWVLHGDLDTLHGDLDTL